MRYKYFLIVIISIIIGIIFYYYMVKQKTKTAVVFDFDETLGDFGQYHQLTKYITLLKGKDEDDMLPLTDHLELLQNFSNYMRPNLINILYFIKESKMKFNYKVVLYTNNQGGKPWVRTIMKVLETYATDNSLFDKIIYAYRIKEGNTYKIIENKRTSDYKKYSDFIAITRYPKNTKVLFFDDQVHPEMKHPNVEYYNTKPYRFSYSPEEILVKLKNIGYNSDNGYNVNITDIKRIISFDSRYSTIKNGNFDTDQMISQRISQIVAGFVSQ